jgi:formamidopyrimidine-DNA glycosylase
MPELPEVETTRRGIEPHLIDQRVARVIVRNARLRWRVPSALVDELPGQRIRAVTRRAKYLLLNADTGTVIVHLGMSGRLRITRAAEPAGKFDHVDIVLVNGECLRLHDPRRFGSVLWTKRLPATHKLLTDLGPEPLEVGFSGEYLHRMTRGRTRAVRDVLLDSSVVAGIGNIYANEALFRAGIRPTRAAGRLSLNDATRLVRAVRATLNRALRAGGTTLRDYRASDGSPGYFQLSLMVYGRTGEPCRTCHTPIRLHRLGQRSAFYCRRCQR